MAGVSEAAAIAIAGLAVTAASTAYSVAAQRKQAGYQVAVENENRKTGLLAAADAIHRGDIAEQTARTRTRLLISQQRAAYAASGVELGSGSPLSTTADTALFGEMDALTIRNNAQREAWGYVAQSDDFKRKSDLLKISARNDTGTTLLTGGSRALNQYSSGLSSGTF
jgi:hypothetical protein